MNIQHSTPCLSFYCSPLMVFLSLQMSLLSAFNSMTHLHSDVDVLQGSTFGCLFTLYSLSDLIYRGFNNLKSIPHPNQSAYISHCYSLATSSRHRDVLQATQTSSPSLASFSKFPFWVNGSIVHPITKFGHYTRIFPPVESSIYIISSPF